MTRIENIRRRARKQGKSHPGPISDALFDNYGFGAKQQFKGEALEFAIERFLAGLPKQMRENFEGIVQELRTLGRDNPKRFRIRVMKHIMVVYQNGSVEGHRLGGGLEIKALFEEVVEELEEKYVSQD
jgi:hypothetical protein